jgi:hypothetical protein
MRSCFAYHKSAPAILTFQPPSFPSSLHKKAWTFIELLLKTSALEPNAADHLRFTGQDEAECLIDKGKVF